MVLDKNRTKTEKILVKRTVETELQDRRKNPQNRTEGQRDGGTEGRRDSWCNSEEE